MALSHEFEYVKAKTIEEAVKLLSKNTNAKILAGGTDLAVHIKEDVTAPDLLIDVKGIEEFKRLNFQDNKLYIGAGITFSGLMKSQDVKQHFRMLWEAAETVASVGIRNRATVAGNICSAVPSLDSAPPLLIYDAKVNLTSIEGKRTVDIKEWFVSPKKTAIWTDEIVTGIVLSLPEEKSGGCYKKLGRYSGEDLAQVGISVLALAGNKYRVAVCAVGPIPKRAEKTEAVLNGNKITPELIKEAKKALASEISPITDIRASKEYRMHMAGVMFERALLEANKLLAGEEVKSEPIM